MIIVDAIMIEHTDSAAFGLAASLIEIDSFPSRPKKPLTQTHLQLT